MLSDRNTSYHGFEFVQGRELLAHVEPRVHLRHDGKVRPRRRDMYDSRVGRIATIAPDIKSICESQELARLR